MSPLRSLAALCLSLSAVACSNGAGNSATSDGASTVGACVEHCKVDADCLRGGEDANWRCLDSICTPTVASPCTTDLECFVDANVGYPPSCDDCGDKAACVDLGDGIGRCERIPNPDFSCADFTMQEVMFPPPGGGAPISVCVNNSACNVETGRCEYRCATDPECPDTGTPHCNPMSHQCECVTDDDCKSNPSTGSVCYGGRCGCGVDADCAIHENRTRCLADGTCGCASDAQCLQADPNTDTCFDGVCGCSADAACVNVKLDNTQIACEVR